MWTALIVAFMIAAGVSTITFLGKVAADNDNSGGPGLGEKFRETH